MQFPTNNSKSMARHWNPYKMHTYCIYILPFFLHLFCVSCFIVSAASSILWKLIQGTWQQMKRRGACDEGYFINAQTNTVPCATDQRKQEPAIMSQNFVQQAMEMFCLWVSESERARVVYLGRPWKLYNQLMAGLITMCAWIMLRRFVRRWICCIVLKQELSLLQIAPGSISRLYVPGGAQR